jgi:hypothetical protein
MTDSIIFKHWSGLALISLQGVLPEHMPTLPWWQVVTGIISIPAGLIGLYYLFLQIKKTLLESKKLEAEVKEGKLEQRRVEGRVSVASEATIKNSKLGAIKGIQTRGGAAQNVGQDVNVFNKGTMENSVAGDIIGVEHQVSPPEETL